MIGLTLLAAGSSLHGDAEKRVSYLNGIRIEAIATPSRTYQNVLVYSRNDQCVFFEHADGLGSAKVTDLDKSTLRQLGIAVDPDPEPMAPSGWATLHPSFWLQQARDLSPLGVTSLVVLVILAVGFYLYCSFLFWMICVKAGTEPGISVWLPVVQIIPLLRAAGMSVLWPLFLLLLPCTSFFLGPRFAHPVWIPAILGAILGFLVLLIWSVKICLVRKKHPLLAACLVLPGTNFFALLYLAGSK